MAISNTSNAPWNGKTVHGAVIFCQIVIVYTMGVFTWTRITFRKTFQNVIQNVIGILI